MFTKEYNDSLNKGFITFILKSIATVLAVAGLLLVTGVANVQFNNDSHVKEVYVDGELVERTTWDELNNIVAGINVHVNIDESSTLWSK